MDWLFLAGLGIIWAALLVPSHHRGSSPRDTVREFGRDMQKLADTERQPGRWVLVPSKDERFLGPRGRAYVRARDRRRAVFTVLIEAVGITALIGLFPPLRLMWVVTGLLVVATIAFVMFLLKAKAEFEATLARVPREARPLEDEREILENDLRIVRRSSRVPEPAVELPPNVRVYAAR